MTIRGNPDRLEQYTSITLPTIPDAHADAQAYGATITALNSAPSTLTFSVSNYSGWIDGELTNTETIDRRPGAFGFALRQLDHFVPDMPRDRTWLHTSDLTLFNAVVDARLAHPDDTPGDVYKHALDSITGTPQELAGRFESVIGQIKSSMSKDHVDVMKEQLLQLMFSLRQNNLYSGPPLTEEEIVHQAWVAIHLDDEIVPADLVQELQDVTGLLGRRRFDSTYTTAFYDALGPGTTALLPQAISLAAWSDYTRTSGNPTFNIDTALANVDSALAVASPNLSNTWRDDLFKGAVDGNKLNDAFPLLFRYGAYSPAFAQPAGQLGLDILHGTVVVDRGTGSPGYPNFDLLATHWEDRGTILLDAAARTPEAANALVRDPRNAGWLTGNKFGRDGRHPPDWDTIDASVRNLIVSGAVYQASANPSLARDAAVNVITGAIAAHPGDASHALASAYGEIVLQYLPDFARSPGMLLSPQNHDGFISIGAMQAAQFTSLAMHDDGSKTAILDLRDILDLQTVVVGLDNGTYMYPSWAQRIANIDGIVLSGDNGEVFVNARQQDVDAKQYNENLDMFQSLAMGVIGLAKFPGSGIVDKVIDTGVDKLKNDFLYEDTSHAAQAGYTTNVADLSAFDHQRLVVAAGQLIHAVHVEQSGGTLTADQAEYINHAQQMLGTPYVDALRAAANGLPVPPVQITPRQLQEWAGNSPLDNGFTDASNYMGWILPADGTSLWPHS